VWLGVLLAVLAVAATAWATQVLGAGGPLGITAVVAAAVVAAFAPSVVEWLVRRGRAHRRAREVAERRPPENPAGLLRADRHVVPFDGRGDEYAELREWCRDDKPPVRLLTGPGGVGKTRLALELGRYLRSCGWQVIVVGAGQEAEALRRLRATTRGSLLLVVDYAETRSGLVELLRSVPDHSAHVRVLLIARSVGDWWDRLGADVPAVRRLVRTQTTMELSTELSEAACRAELVRAVPHFAGALGVAAPDHVDVSVPGVAPRLVLHAAALVAVLRAADGGQLTPAGQVVADLGVLDELLGHEQRYWAQSAAQAGLAGISGVALRRAVAVSCLLPAEDEAAAARLLRRVPDLVDGEGPRRQVARWLAQLYPGRTGFWGSLQPDLVAEAHVIAEVTRCPELVLTGLDELRPPQARQLLTVLSLAAAHRPADRWVLEKLLRAELDRLLPAALAVATASGGALCRVLVRVLATAPLTPRRLRQIDREIPYPSTALAGAAVAVARRVLATLPADADPAESAYRWERLAVMDAQAGRTAAARRHSQRAVERYQALVEADRRRFLPDLARCLHLLAIQDAELDWHDRAVEHARQAERHYRALQDDLDRHAADRAACLHNLGTWLAALGRREEALPLLEEAVRGYQELVDSDPERYLRDVTEALRNRDLCRSELHRTTEPLPELRRAVRQAREHAEREPDHYLPDLARALHNLGAWHLEQGELAEALPTLEEALGHFQKLVSANSRYRSDLAACENDLGVNLFRLDRVPEAVSHARQAVAVNTALHKTSPHRTRAELARSLDNLIVFLAGQNEHAEARRHAEQAVRLYRDLAALDPGRYRPELARALTNLGVSLSELGRHAEAQPLAWEAMSVCRTLTEEDPDQYWPHLARALDNLAVDYTALRRHADADRCRQEADRLRESHGECPPHRRRWGPRRGPAQRTGALPGH
jgi:tetratricopeptide (TPR) repeat protein